MCVPLSRNGERLPGFCREGFAGAGIVGRTILGLSKLILSSGAHGEVKARLRFPSVHTDMSSSVLC
ncbi:hypothetical protein OH76DRAFT_1395450 [Lentinus brumalis]|uniref:Uncharacterized protein n=1 Tax=Lentinus brumalis TaxID=2498619 RepID=A0A371DUW7_9APHY|nr:hypothetical protein OH76DRAFT_1395450 [Polyporus brumalis]